MKENCGLSWRERVVGRPGGKDVYDQIGRGLGICLVFVRGISMFIKKAFGEGGRVWEF